MIQYRKWCDCTRLSYSQRPVPSAQHRQISFHGTGLKAVSLQTNVWPKAACPGQNIRPAMIS
jgi:hypothetical protein